MVIRTFIHKTREISMQLLEEHPNVYRVWINNRETDIKDELIVAGIDWNNLFKKFKEV